MKWFVSYVCVTNDGRLLFEHSVYTPQGELSHPVRLVRERNDSVRANERNWCRYILLSFQQVDDSVPDTNESSFGIGPWAK